MQVLRSNLRPGFSVYLPRISAHDLPEKAGLAPLAISRLPQFFDRSRVGQPDRSVLHVEKQSASDSLYHHSIFANFESRDVPVLPVYIDMNGQIYTTTAEPVTFKSARHALFI